MKKTICTETDLLGQIRGPKDLKKLTSDQLAPLAAQIRSHLVRTVAKTGGHLGPNLGVVELTIALHRIFDSPSDSIIFDTGHQSYVHKLLTGRQDFHALRSREGLSGYPSREESSHDVVENSHASTALSWADGLARARVLDGSKNHVVAVIGDGALTGGMAWEALNNIAESRCPNLVVVVNDNGRSYAPTIGGLAHHLDALRTSQSYEAAISWGKKALKGSGKAGELAYDALHGFKKGVKDVLAPQVMFEDLGLKYIGPVDGHDPVAMEFALSCAKGAKEPVIVHAITEKGRGFTPAETDENDRFHAVGKIHPETGLPVVAERFGWTAVFADEVVKAARRNKRLVGITAAMKIPVGLDHMSAEFPDRVFDVGIAEQHALTCAAGLAFGGKHPVVALYATFLNRAYDQVLMDCALHKAGVTIVLDRAGLTGNDGASHNGMWDMALLSTVPNLRLAAPRDEATLRSQLREAFAVDDAVTVVRYPKGPVIKEIPALRTENGLDILAQPKESGNVAKPNILLVGVGPMCQNALHAAEALQNVANCTVIDPKWVIPTSPELVSLAKDFDVVCVVEDGLENGGVGSGLRDALAKHDSFVPVLEAGIDKCFFSTASREQLEADCKLGTNDIVDLIRAHISKRSY